VPYAGKRAESNISKNMAKGVWLVPYRHL
jgi:hypothetical protein